METRSRKRTESASSSSSSPPSPLTGPITRSAKRGRVDTSAAGNSLNMNTNTNAKGSRSRSGARGQEGKPGERAAENESGPGPGPGPSRRGRRGKKAELGRVDKGKGKVKENDVRVSDRDREAVERGVDIGGGEGEGNGNDNEGGDLLSRRNLSSSSSSLQGILRKFGGRYDDLLPVGGVSGMHQSGRFNNILSGLRADGEEERHIESLIQLCEMLSISTENSLSTFPVDSFVPVLVGLLNCETSPEIMLLAARALTHLCDALPSSCSVVVHYGAVPCFCARLLTIEYMDLAEQSLQALKKISQENPTTCLRAGALMAVLSYLDFFSTGVQRVALATAENICKKLPSDAADYVMEAVPLLTNLLQNHDSKVLDHASVCLARIAEGVASSPDKLDELCNHGLVTQAANLISTSNSGVGQASLSTPTYTGLIRLLSACASGSTLAAKTLLHLGISGILKDILLGSGVSANSSVSPALSRPLDQIFEIVSLANELLPPLPQGVIPLPASSSLFIKASDVKQPSSSSRGNQEGTNVNVPEASSREILLKEQPELLQQFGMDLLPVIIQIYGSSVGGPVRHRSLLVIGKLMYFSTSEVIQSFLDVTNISSFLAGILGWKDQHVLLPALHISGILMEKLPGTFSKMFIREGGVHAVEQLILVDKLSGMTAQPSAKKDKNPVAGTSTRSRRCRRRGGNSNVNFDAAEGANNQISANLGSPHDSVKTPSVNSDLCMKISMCAKTFKDKHFPSVPGTDDVGVTDDLLRLKSLCTKLNSGAETPKTKGKGRSRATFSSLTDFSAEKEEYLLRVISEMLAEICKGDGVSTFEFIGSGVVEAFLNYFSCGFFFKERIPETKLPKLREQVHKRFKYFIDVALPSTVDKGRAVPMVDLVQKLQNALTSLEHFPVMLSQSPRSSSGNAQSYSGLGVLSQHLKLRLCRAQAEKSLRDFSSNIVLIDPLANWVAVEEFLWPRVQQSESGQKSTESVGNSEHKSTPTGVSASSTAVAPDRCYSTRFRPSASMPVDADKKEPAPEKGTSSSKGKGKAALQPEQDTRGPQTRSAARRKAALAEHEQAKTFNEDSTSEGEDLDMSHVGTDDAMMIEDDDISDDEDLLRDDDLPICTPCEVHDVHLSDSADGNIITPAVPDRQANPASGSSSKAAATSGSSYVGGALSFAAAAAMSGLGSENGRSISGGRDCHSRDLYGGSNDPPKLLFNAKGKQLNRNLTIYQGIHRQVVSDEDDERYAGSDFASSGGSRLWNDVYKITYQKADAQADKSLSGQSSIRQSKSTTSRTTASSFSDAHSDQMSLIDSILQGSLPCDIEKSNPTYNILALLRVLESLNELSPHLRAQIVVDQFAEDKISTLDELITAGNRVPQEDFLNSKLTPKLARQIQDALAICSGSLPSWCYQLTKACPFLFTFETRRQYFYSTSFGLSRTLHRLQQLQGADGNVPLSERELRLTRLQRQKVRVSRNRILDSAAKVMELYSSQKAVLEVEYFGEVGSGLGPTLEFYTLLSRDLQKVGLGMWRSNSSLEEHAMGVDGDEQTTIKSGNHSGLGLVGNNDVVQAPLGLFPRPWAPKAEASDGSKFFKVIEYFRLLGCVMAKALQDGRLLDLPFSTAFYKLVLGHELNLHDILSFDAELGKSLQELHALVCRKKYLESIEGDNREAICDLHFRGSRVEDLCLDFTVPGHPDYILKSGDEIVDIHNLEEYISLVVDATVKTGIMRQMKAFRAGFNQIFDVSSLQIFTPLEVDYLLCGRRELWKADSLVEHIKFDHGYNAKSIPIINLLEIMGEFTPEQQQAFCQFVTGAPRLPPGGLAVLKPKLTVVRKHPSTNGGYGPSQSPDNDLPSVMTCANYLKLPAYSTKEIMYKKLLYAISEGQGSFDLS